MVDLPGKSKELSGPAKSVSELKDRRVTIAIDAGHGGDDPGSIGPRGTYENTSLFVLPVHWPNSLMMTTVCRLI